MMPLDQDDIEPRLSDAQDAFRRGGQTPEQGLDVASADLVQLRKACRLLSGARHLLEDGYYTLTMGSYKAAASSSTPSSSRSTCPNLPAASSTRGRPGSERTDQAFSKAVSISAATASSTTSVSRPKLGATRSGLMTTADSNSSTEYSGGPPHGMTAVSLDFPGRIGLGAVAEPPIGSTTCPERLVYF